MRALSFIHLFAYLFPLLPFHSLAAPGDLDVTFGSGGKVITHFASGDSLIRSVALQRDGKIVAAGFAKETIRASTYSNFAVARYNEDGNLDMTFNGTGIRTTVGGTFGAAYSVAVQEDGKIVVAGSGAASQTQSVFAMIRLNADGTYDTTFNGTGKVTTAIGTYAQCFRAALQSDGKILLGGYSDLSHAVFTLARYNRDGSLDASFNGNGIVTTDLGSQTGVIWAVSPQSDGTIIVAGDRGRTPYAGSDICLARYTSTGSLDASFGSAGITITSFAGGSSIRDLEVQADGKIVITGQLYQYLGVFRFTANGMVDTSFNGSGAVSATDAAYGEAVMLRGGKIISAGFTGTSFYVARYRSNGLPDQSFGAAGAVQTTFRSRSSAFDALLQEDGKIVVAGSSVPSSGSGSDFGLARYLGDRPGSDFDQNGTPDLVLFDPASGHTQVEFLRQNVRIKAAYGPGIPPGWQLAKVADFDGDGKPDYFLSHSNGTLYVWLLNGTTLAHGVQLPYLPAGWQLAAVADMNSDGKPDLILLNPATRSLAVWLLDGAARKSTLHITQAGVRKTLPTGWNVAGAADFNGDGKPDLVLFHPATRKTAIWYLNGTNFTGQVAGPTIAAGWTLAGVADFNSDGNPDFLISEIATGRDGIWTLNGLTVTNATYLVDGAGVKIIQPTGWNIVAP